MKLSTAPRAELGSQRDPAIPSNNVQPGEPRHLKDLALFGQEDLDACKTLFCSAGRTSMPAGPSSTRFGGPRGLRDFTLLGLEDLNACRTWLHSMAGGTGLAPPGLEDLALPCSAWLKKTALRNSAVLTGSHRQKRTYKK